MRGYAEHFPSLTDIKKFNRTGAWMLDSFYHMGRDTRKPIFGGVWTTKAQTSLCIHTDWSAPFLFAYWKVT